jgi:NAD(P)-dependent dehydrogenase (short-subunit alcohol dehydrogenase family)
MSNTTQVALVTGGGRGLGRAFAQGLAAQDMAVAITSRSKAELDEVVASISQAGGRAIAFVGDVTDASSVDKIVAEVEEQLGPIDVLVNNAGVFRALHTFLM